VEFELTCSALTCKLVEFAIVESKRGVNFLVSTKTLYVITSIGVRFVSTKLRVYDLCLRRYRLRFVQT
jgi:hypothetical protein